LIGGGKTRENQILDARGVLTKGMSQNPGGNREGKVAPQVRKFTTLKEWGGMRGAGVERVKKY